MAALLSAERRDKMTVSRSSRLRGNGDQMRRSRLEDAGHMYGGSVPRAADAMEGLGKTYLDAPHMAVRGDRHRVVLEIRSGASSINFRDGMERCLHALDMTQATCLLMDLRKMRLVLVDDERWLAQELLPRFATTALKRMAVVTPENALASNRCRSRQAEAHRHGKQALRHRRRGERMVVAHRRAIALAPPFDWRGACRGRIGLMAFPSAPADAMP